MRGPALVGDSGTDYVRKPAAAVLRACHGFGRSAVTMLAEPQGQRVRATSDPFERLFFAEYPRVVAIARRVVGDLHSAEDVAQDVFVAFARGHDPSAPFAAAWLHRAAVHSALNHQRSVRRRAAREASFNSLDQRRRTVQGADADPLAAAVRAEERRDVQAALACLGTKPAAALALRYAGLSYAEVAAALGVKVNQVGTILVRAESAFKKEIARVAPG